MHVFGAIAVVCVVYASNENCYTVYMEHTVATTICALDASTYHSFKRIRQIPIISATFAVFASSLHSFHIYRTFLLVGGVSYNSFTSIRFCFCSSSGVSFLLTAPQYSCYLISVFVYFSPFGIAYDEGH